ncbi:MAG: hypothetical protein ACR2OH_01665 [Microthrixaceae bacterium]
MSEPNLRRPGLIDLLTNSELRSLATQQHPHCVSMYLPTHRAGPEVQQDPIRLKNLIASARDELVDLGLRREEAEEFLAPAKALLSDSDFWAHGERGLAVLVGPDGVHIYRLADAGDELVVVSDRFHVKPLIRSLAAGESYWILAISQNHVRLLRGDPNGASELALEEIPESLAEALWFEDRERQLQSHSANRVGAGRVTATFHGQGGAKDTRHSDLSRFLRAVDHGVAHVCADNPDPVVLAGVERDIAAYREITQNKHVVPEALTGNCDRLSPIDLHGATWPLVQPHFDADLVRVRETIAAGSAPSETHVAAAHRAAEGGRIEALVVALGVRLWGSAGVDADEGTHADRQSGDRDLLDAVAIEAMVHGGAVYAVDPDDVPERGHLAALLRW